LIEQAQLIAASFRPIMSYKEVMSTCSDERERLVLLNGQKSSEPRAQVFGGSTMYGHAISELTGQASGSTALERVAGTDRMLSDAGIHRGAHMGCAACAGIHTWMGKISEDPESVKAYAASQLGDKYDEKIADAVVKEATRVHESGLFDGFNEASLQSVYGDDAGFAFETLQPVDHEGQTVARIKRELVVPDTDYVYKNSAIGKGSFMFIDPYADTIEHAMTTGPDAAYLKVQAEHAREIMIAAIAGAVPNPVLYQLDIY
jgi:hypothetical protein